MQSPSKSLTENDCLKYQKRMQRAEYKLRYDGLMVINRVNKAIIAYSIKFTVSII